MPHYYLSLRQNYISTHIDYKLEETDNCVIFFNKQETIPTPTYLQSSNIYFTKAISLLKIDLKFLEKYQSKKIYHNKITLRALALSKYLFNNRIAFLSMISNKHLFL